MARRSDVLRISAGESRGTGFFIGPDRVLAALHVIGNVVDGDLRLHGASISITAEVPAETAGSSSQLPVCVCTREDVIDRDPDLDWAVIRVDEKAFPNAFRPALGKLAHYDQNMEWSTYGFPDTDPQLGNARHGTVASTGAPLRLGSNQCNAIQLFSREAAAPSGAAVDGFSGGPVFVENHVIGFLCCANTTANGKSAAGTLYAIPLTLIASRLGLTLRVRESEAHRLDIEPREHERLAAQAPLGQRFALGVGIMFLVFACFTAIATEVPVKGTFGMLGTGSVLIALAMVFHRIPHNQTGSILKWFMVLIVILILGLAYAMFSGIYEAVVAKPDVHIVEHASGIENIENKETTEEAPVDGMLLEDGQTLTSHEGLTSEDLVDSSIAGFPPSDSAAIDAPANDALADAIRRGALSATDNKFKSPKPLCYVNRDTLRATPLIGGSSHIVHITDSEEGKPGEFIVGFIIYYKKDAINAIQPIFAPLQREGFGSQRKGKILGAPNQGERLRSLAQKMAEKALDPVAIVAPSGHVVVNIGLEFDSVITRFRIFSSAWSGNGLSEEEQESQWIGGRLQRRFTSDPPRGGFVIRSAALAAASAAL